MAFIEIRDLTIEFTRVAEDGTEVPGTRALDGISLDIEKGSFVAVSERGIHAQDRRNVRVNSGNTPETVFHLLPFCGQGGFIAHMTAGAAPAAGI